MDVKSTEEISALTDVCRSHNIDNVVQETCRRNHEKKCNGVDFLLENIVGPGGWGQWFIFICHLPCYIALVIPLFIQMFAAFEPRHRCFVPNCDGISNISAIMEAPFVDYSLPKAYGSSEMLREDEPFNPCQMYDVRDKNTATCSPLSFDNSSVIGCNKYVYDTSEMIETLTTKLNLVCDDEFKSRFLGTLLMLGLLIGSLIGGWLGDKFGRKVTMIASHLIMTPVVMFSGFSPNYETYAVLRLISASCLPIFWVCGHSLMLELFGKEYRNSVIMLKSAMGPPAQLILVMITYTTRNWTYIHLFTGVACLIPIPFYFFIPESPRWLTINGKQNHAYEILLTIAERNGKSLTKHQRDTINDTLVNIRNEANSFNGQENLSPRDMVRPMHLRKTLVLMVYWVTINVGVYTLQLNATKLHGNFLLNYTLVALSELPSSIVLLINLRCFGRRFSLFYVEFILGTFSFY